MVIHVLLWVMQGGMTSASSMRRATSREQNRPNHVYLKFPHQLVNSNPIQIHQAFARWNISNVVSNYVVISIEGPQSSGKSLSLYSLGSHLPLIRFFPLGLLLNRLFDTQFQVMHPLMLQQTTKGNYSRLYALTFNVPCTSDLHFGQVSG